MNSNQSNDTFDQYSEDADTIFELLEKMDQEINQVMNSNDTFDQYGEDADTIFELLEKMDQEINQVEEMLLEQGMELYNRPRRYRN